MEYFQRSEFACKCGCGFATVDYELAEVVDELRGYFGKPVLITSGCRCEVHNSKVGGSKNSKHKLGIACDLKVLGVDAEVVYQYLNTKYLGKYGIGLYDSWVHIDVRLNKARWIKTTD
jgi:uncharacterized protein YcbK (DUF882 family)